MEVVAKRSFLSIVFTGLSEQVAYGLVRTFLEWPAPMHLMTVSARKQNTRHRQKQDGFLAIVPDANTRVRGRRRGRS